MLGWHGRKWLYRQALIGPAAAQLLDDHYKDGSEKKPEMPPTKHMWKATEGIDRKAQCADLSIISSAALHI